MSLGADPATHEPRIIIVKWYGYGRRFPFKLLLLFMMVGCYCRHLHALPIVRGFSFSSIRSSELTNRWEIICEIFLADQSWTNGWTMIIFQDIWITSCMNIICKFQRHFLYSSFAFTWYKGETEWSCVVLAFENKRTIMQRICEIWVIIGFRSRELIIQGSRIFSSFTYLSLLLQIYNWNTPTSRTSTHIPSYINHSVSLGTGLGFWSLRMNANEHSQTEMQH